MTSRTHFWLRIAGIALIAAAQFAPRLHLASSEHRPQGPAAAAAAVAMGSTSP